MDGAHYAFGRPPVCSEEPSRFLRLLTVAASPPMQLPSDSELAVPPLLTEQQQGAVETTVDKELEPICAACLTPLRGLWAATSPRGFLICGEGNCQRWAAVRGESIMFTGDDRATVAEPVPPRRHAGCDKCGTRVTNRDYFRIRGFKYCTLTCMQADQPRL